MIVEGLVWLRFTIIIFIKLKFIKDKKKKYNHNNRRIIILFQCAAMLYLRTAYTHDIVCLIPSIGVGSYT